MTIEPVRRTLLRESAYEAIRDAIVRGDLPAGASVGAAELAGRLGLSRAPVREALARLAGEGLVESKPQSFTRVTPVDERDVRDAAAVVCAMHELAVGAAVPLLTAADLDEMRAANERFAAAADVDAALRADDELHDVPVRVCGNRAVAATVARYTPLIRRLERQRFAAGAHASTALHADLIAACAAGDAAAAVRVTRQIWQSLTTP
ncbi:GntR family transcriptional regulator [Spirilliplanes yamanashiensis]|uniref:GntR family transcriptional regulator n=1 Tax=Spirilliplanes yamanashiensis TaxID=42233 RepID=A0A8J4DJN8_9ACTN|nr:GntR family transcriptional regulator [Spirilliplanes yamanashiensis]MDP9817152.1 DNA-binding GntR family transcriptional regulator [Spirilliplanes yamanashiensis]GIJ03195.1 GntR family transcriptional regulator [Spirilliplanes yamanashiensis]